MKAAAGPKSAKTDGRALLANSTSLRYADDKAPDKAAAAAAGTEDEAAAAEDAEGSRKDDNNNTVIASGFAVVADYTDKVAANDFFTPGRVFAVRVKHSSFPGSLPTSRHVFRQPALSVSAFMAAFVHDTHLYATRMRYARVDEGRQFYLPPSALF